MDELSTRDIWSDVPTFLAVPGRNLRAPDASEYGDQLLVVLEAMLFGELAISLARMAQADALGPLAAKLKQGFERPALGVLIQLCEEVHRVAPGCAGWRLKDRLPELRPLAELARPGVSKKAPRIRRALDDITAVRNSYGHPSRRNGPLAEYFEKVDHALGALVRANRNFSATILLAEEVRLAGDGSTMRARQFRGPASSPYQRGRLLPVAEDFLREGDLVARFPDGAMVHLGGFVVHSNGELHLLASIAGAPRYWSPTSGSQTTPAKDETRLQSLLSNATTSDATTSIATADTHALVAPLNEATYERVASVLSPKAAQDWLRASDIAIPWPVVLAALDHENTDASEENVSELPEWMTADDEEVALEFAANAGLPEPTHLVLGLKQRGTLGRGLEIQSRWLEEGREVEAATSGALVTCGAHIGRLTLSQRRALDVLTAPGALGKNRAADVGFVARLTGGLRENDGVELGKTLERNAAHEVDAVKPRLHSIGGGFQVRPQVDAIPDEQLEDLYYGGPSRWNEPLAVRGPGGHRQRFALSERAKKGLRRCRELDKITVEQAAVALTRPEEFFGEDLDVSAFGERVIGFGPLVKRTYPVVREIEALSWWDWSGEVEFADAEGARVSAINFKDPEMRAAMARSIESADEAGVAFIPHPAENDVLLELSPALRGQLAHAEKLSQEKEATPTPKEEPKREVLQVMENIESLELDRAPGEVPQRRLRLGAPPNLNASYQLFDYQQEGYEWLASLYDESQSSDGWGGAMLADDMGLGKTIQVLSFLSWLRANRPDSGPHLLVAPVGLLDNWWREAQKFFGSTLQVIYQVSGAALPKDPKEAADRLKGVHLVMVSYATLRRHEMVFAHIKWDIALMDEAQKAKNPASQISRVVRTLDARFRLAMTGTPVENSLKDLWTLYDWAVPGLLGSLRQFADGYIKPLAGEADLAVRDQLAHQVQDLVKPVFVRRLKSNVLADLPPIHHQRHAVPMSASQSAAYDSVLQNKSDDRGQALGALIRLFGATAHPNLPGIGKRDVLPPTSSVSFPKIEVLFGILDEVAARSEKAIVFVGRVPVQHWLQTELALRYGVKVEVINGAVTDSKARMARIERFSKSLGFGVIVLAPKAAGVGLNITAANHVIHYTREWNPAIENQATDRAYRMGQIKPVHVHTLICTSPHGTTVDERLDQLLTAKRDLMKRFVVPMGGFEIRPDELAVE